MKKSLTLLTLFIIITTSSFAQIPTWDWANNFGGNSTINMVNDACVDANGNIYVVGSFENEFQIGTDFYQTSVGNLDIYIVKFDSQNNYLWAKTFGSVWNDQGFGITTDANDDVYITGHIDGNIDLGNNVTLTELDAQGVWDAIVVKFDGTDGTALWGKSLGGSDAEQGKEICTDNSGNVYVAGSFGSTADFGGTSMTAASSKDGFIAKFDTSGDIQWAKQVSGNSFQGVFAMDSYGDNIAIAGPFVGEALIGTTTLTGEGSIDLFSAVISTDGDFSGVNHIAGGGNKLKDIVSVAIDNNGNIAVTASFTGDIDFNGTPIPSSSQSGFVVYYDNTNTYSWHKIFKTTTKWETNIISKKVAFNAEGDLYVGGGYVGIVDFGNGNEHDAEDYSDIFLAKYNNLGECQWVETSTNTTNSDGGDFIAGLAISQNGSVYTAGEFKHTMTFADETLVTPGDATQIFIAKTVSESASDENDILTFVFDEQTGDATINNVNHTVEIEVEAGTNLTSLIPTITISDFATISPETGNAQNFSAPFEYIVTAENSDEQIWTVTVTALQNTENDILTFDFIGIDEGSININDVNHTIEITVPEETNLTTLTPEITISAGATISPESGTYQDFTNPVIYTVTAGDITEQEWIVTVAATQSTGNDILTFDFADINENSINISVINHTVSIEVPNGTNITALIPEITISEGATISPDNGVEQNFSSDFIYTVTSDDLTEQEWIVSVITASAMKNIVNKLSIYPNPSNGIFTIDFKTSARLLNVSITDITGKTIKQYPITCTERSRSVNLKNQPAGIYFIKISSRNEFFIRKLIVK